MSVTSSSARSNMAHPSADPVDPAESLPLINNSNNPQVNDIQTPLTLDNFFDPQKGWIKFWNPALTFRQLTVRERNPSFYAFDAFRALAFLWVSNDHVQEGLKILYADFEAWIETQSSSRAYADSSDQGVTVFFVISGFLNLYVALRISDSFQEKYVSWKTMRNFLFRRYMHLAPNLYVAVCIALMLGCLSGLALLDENFCVPCKSHWWTNFLFIQNFSDQMFEIGTDCYNSTWTIGAEMQFYICSVPLVFLYKYSPFSAFAAVIVLIGLVVVLRTEIILFSAEDGGTWAEYAYQPFYSRGDAYLFGMALYMM